MSQSRSTSRSPTAVRMTRCGIGFFHSVSPGTVGVLVPASADLKRYLSGIPGTELLPTVAGMVHALVSLLHMPEISRVLRDPPSAPAVAACRGRIW
jgi:uncharacterized protein YigA (DUF484 family)